MKWTKISYQDYEDLQKVLKFCDVLVSLDIKSADEAYGVVNEEIQDEFCGECKSSNDHCECYKGADYDGPDEDALYDRWKDDQMENDNG